MKRWFIPAAARARGQTNDLNREILASNLFNSYKEVINAPPVPSISRCIHIVYRNKNVWKYQWSNFIYNCMSTFLHYVHCKDALFDCSAPGGERCESLTWVDEICRLVAITVFLNMTWHDQLFSVIGCLQMWSHKLLIPTEMLVIKLGPSSAKQMKSLSVVICYGTSRVSRNDKSIDKQTLEKTYLNF